MSGFKWCNICATEQANNPTSKPEIEHNKAIQGREGQGREGQGRERQGRARTLQSGGASKGPAQKGPRKGAEGEAEHNNQTTSKLKHMLLCGPCTRRPTEGPALLASRIHSSPKRWQCLPCQRYTLPHQPPSRNTDGKEVGRNVSQQMQYRREHRPGPTRQTGSIKHTPRQTRAKTQSVEQHAYSGSILQNYNGGPS